MSLAPDDSGNAIEVTVTESQPKTVSKTAFGILSWSLFFVILSVQLGIVVALSRGFGIHVPPGWTGGLGILHLFLARLAADAILKAMGLSRSGKTVEARGRTVALAEGEVDDDEVVEVRCPAPFLTQLGVMCLAICLLLVGLFVVIPPDLMRGGVGWFYVLIGFFALEAVFCFYQRWWGAPQARADASGIRGASVGFHLRTRFVPWSDVATCEIETYHNTFGKPIIIRPILKGWDGTVLLALDLRYTQLDDQERLVKYIRAKLPKPKLDLWE